MIASLEDNGESVWFRLVRSSTPPGRNLGLLATRRPFDSPSLNTFYYRLQRPKTGTAIDIFSWRGYAKSHAEYQ
ncbi:MAG: hypothetical protein ACJA09_000145 [Alcanivorax sp.]|jgi:hypothetical protein